MNEYRIELPWPPGNNHLFSVFRGRKIKSKKGREYTTAVTRQITEANQQYQLAGKARCLRKMIFNCRFKPHGLLLSISVPVG